MATATNGITTRGEIAANSAWGGVGQPTAFVSTETTRLAMRSEIAGVTAGTGTLGVRNIDGGSTAYMNTQCVKYSDVTWSINSLGTVTVYFTYYRDDTSLGGYIVSVDLLNSTNVVIGSITGTGLSPESPGGSTLSASRTGSTSYSQVIYKIRVNINVASGRATGNVWGGGMVFTPGYFQKDSTGLESFDISISPISSSGNISFNASMNNFF